MTTQNPKSFSGFIKNYSMDYDFFTLCVNIKTIGSTTDALEFYFKINESIEILEHIAQLVRNKRNTFGEKVPAVILFTIFFFLP